jgi:hypothetical protein
MQLCRLTTTARSRVLDGCAAVVLRMPPLPVIYGIIDG